MLRPLLWALPAGLMVIQFIRPDRNVNEKTATGDITQVYIIPDTVQTILRQACYDCHSNNTRYPWYMNIQPAGWFMAGHVRDGKAELNFNEYTTYTAKRRRSKLKSIQSQITKGEMPLSSYTLLHRDARLSDAQKKMITQWIDSVLMTK